MHYLLISSLFFTCFTGQLLSKSQNGKEPLTRREITYTTNVLHTNPYFPDQQAESNVQVELGNYKPKPSSYPKPRSLVTRSHRPYKVEENKSPHRSKPVKLYDQYYQGSSQHSTKTIPKTSGSQLFNVGYSVSFSKGPKKSKPIKDEDPEIIRGTNTGLVQKPSESQEYVVNTISDTKRPRHKSKPKHKYRSPHAETEDPEISLLSSKTRQSYAGLGRPQTVSGFKSDEPSFKKERNGGKLPLRINLDTNPVNFHSDEQQNIHQEMVQFLNSQPQLHSNEQPEKDSYSQAGISTSYNPKGQGHQGYEGPEEVIPQDHRLVVQKDQRNKVQFPQTSQNHHHQQQQKINWKNLGPNVEIYHSPELPPETFKFDPSEHLEQSKKFDHARALGRSQGFDYSNAVGVENFQISKQNVTESSAEESRSAEDPLSQQVAHPTNTFTQTQNPNPFNLNNFNFDTNQSPHILGASAAPLTANPSFAPNFNVIPIDTSLIPMHFDSTIFQLAPQNDHQQLLFQGGGYLPQLSNVPQQQGLSNPQFNTAVPPYQNNPPVIQNLPIIIKPNEGPSELSYRSKQQVPKGDGFAEQSSKESYQQKYTTHRVSESTGNNQRGNTASRAPVTFKGDQNDDTGEASVRKPVGVRYEYHPRKGGTSSLWPLLSNERNRRYSVRI